VDVYAGLSPDQFPILSAILAATDEQRFDSDRQFEDLLDAYVRGLQARIAERA
jgi:hypothetical protein